MIVNPVMYGGGSKEMRTITITASAGSATTAFGYYDENGNFMTVSPSLTRPASITLPVGTVLASSINASIDGLSVHGVGKNGCYLYRVEP